MQRFEILSVWEVEHRWHGFDPDELLDEVGVHCNQ